MYISDWTKHDGYHEAVAGIDAQFNPIFKLRAVLLSDGKFQPILRDYISGHHLNESPALADLGAAKYQCMRLASLFLQETYQAVRNKIITQRG